MWIVWQTIKRITNEILGVKGLTYLFRTFLGWRLALSNSWCLHSPSNSHFFKGMWRENYNYGSQIALALLNVKLTSKSLTEGLVYRVAARLSIARAFSVRVCTPWKGRLLLMKSLTAFLNSELRKLYKTGLMAELRKPNIRKTVFNLGYFAISMAHFQLVSDAQKWVRQPTDHERENDQKRCLGCANVPLL